MGKGFVKSDNENNLVVLFSKESEKDILLFSDDFQIPSKGSKLKRKDSAISIDDISIFH